ncbi:MAG: LysR family transcriptional regulator [Desulfovibrionaceae bacterium]|nr:LysR family transcriptional regulator [Desulfovibrionaceae bacterium]
MNLTHLRSFLAAADEMHFGKAAKRLNIVQPALSAHIKALEEEFGGQLFFRIGKQVALTNPGRILQHEAQRIFNDIQLMKTAVSQAMSGKTGLLNISYCDIPEMHMLMLPLNEMQTRYPDLYIRLWEENLSSISGGLNDGRLDIAFFTLSSHFQLPPILEIKKICTWALRLALPQNHPLAQTEGPLKIRISTMKILLSKASPLIQLIGIYSESAALLPILCIRPNRSLSFANW